MFPKSYPMSAPVGIFASSTAEKRIEVPTDLNCDLETAQDDIIQLVFGCVKIFSD